MGASSSFNTDLCFLMAYFFNTYMCGTVFDFSGTPAPGELLGAISNIHHYQQKEMIIPPPKLLSVFVLNSRSNHLRKVD